MAEVPYYAIKDIPTKRAIQALINEIAGLRKLVAASGGRVVVQEGGGGGGESYVLPVATAARLGGIKVGANLSITQGGVLNAAGATPYVLPVASADTLGGVKVGNGLAITDGVLRTTGGGGSTVSVDVPTGITGTQIAKITVDGTDYFIVAPNGGGGSAAVATYIRGSSAEVGNTNNSITISTAANFGNLVIAVIVHRDELVATPTGWTLLFDHEGTWSTSDIRQWVAVFYKFADSSSVSITVEQASNARMYANIHVFANAGTPTMHIVNMTAAANTNLSLNKNIDNTVLWLAHSSYWDNISQAHYWTCSDSRVLIQQLSGSQPRLGTFVDDRPMQLTYTIHGASGSSCNVVAHGVAIPAA